jgi:pimeloyl-ACP methyl ester carboxylesterase
MPQLRIQDVTIEYDDAGQGDAVMLLHGFPTTRRLWSEVAAILVKAGFRTIVPDLAGYGGSTCPPSAEPDMASQASWMLGLLDALGIPQVALVAHDVGTAAAQIMMARAPARLRAAVLVDGVYASEWAMDAVAPIATWKEPARLHRVLLRQLRASGGPTRLDETAAREVLAPYESERGGVQLIRAARALRPEQAVDLLPILRERRVPALVLWGERDAYLETEAVGRPLADLLGAPLCVFPAGHFLPLERPDLVAAAVVHFLAKPR